MEISVICCFDTHGLCPNCVDVGINKAILRLLDDLWRYFKRMHVKPKPQPVALPPPYVHSFAEYRNPENNNFGVLRVMNDDLVRADVHTIDTIEM